MLHMKELVQGGYVGEVLSCHMSLFGSGVLTRTSGRTWQRDVTLGANTHTISFGHAIDALCMCLGEFKEVSSVISTQVPQWRETDTNKMVDVTSPDNILLNGVLESGAVVSAHTASIPWHGSGFRLEVYGATSCHISADVEAFARKLLGQDNRVSMSRILRLHVRSPCVEV